MQKCPFCAEEIQEEAIKCKHCGEWLQSRETGISLYDELSEGGKKFVIDEFKRFMKRKSFFSWLHAWSFYILCSIIMAFVLIGLWRFIKFVFDN